MAVTISGWFSNLNGIWKVAAIVTAIFGAGLTTGAAAGGFTKLPGRIVALEQRADTLTSQLTALRRDVSEIRNNNRIQLCLQIAEKQKTDWRECLTNVN